jgi:hypothetical protein
LPGALLTFFLCADDFFRLVVLFLPTLLQLPPPRNPDGNIAKYSAIFLGAGIIFCIDHYSHFIMSAERDGNCFRKTGWGLFCAYQEKTRPSNERTGLITFGL